MVQGRRKAVSCVLWLAGGAALGRRGLTGQAGLPESLLMVVVGKNRVLPSWPLARQRHGLSMTGSTFDACVMPLLLTGRDGEECRTKDVPTVAMAVAEPPSLPSPNPS